MDYFHLQKDSFDMSNLGLAYLGDSVFELMVRSWLCLHGKLTPKGLHKAALGYVAAPAQAAMTKKLIPALTEEETDIYRRGRNTNPHSVPKAAKREEYQAATALEAVFGWLYLKGETARLNELFDIMMAGEGEH
ncbi:MAG: ribonuclease III domain-containing protein [Evtepia sp.]